MVETELVVKIASGGAGQTVRDVAKVQEALAKMGKSAKDTAQLAQQLGKAFNLDASEVEELAKALGQVKDETEQATEATGRYVDANGRLREANGRFVKGATQGMKDVANETAAAAKQAGKLDEILTGFLRRLGEKGLDIGIQAFQALGAAIQDTVARANQEFGAFDQALTKFSAKSGIARDNLKALEEESVRLAAITSQTPASVAELAEQLLALGATSEQVQERLNGITVLADLVGESAVTTGKVVQTALNIFGDFGETSDGVADKINTFINTTAAGSSQGIEEFLQLFQTTGSAAKGLGVQFDELGTAFAVLRDNGFSAEVAATGLKTAMLKIGAPTGAAAAELEKLGVKAFDAEGKFVGLESVFQQLKETTQTLTQEELIEAVNNIGGAEGVPALLALIDQVDGRWQTVSGNVAEAQGSAAESLEVLNQSVERQAELLSGNLSGAYTKLGEAIAPIRQSLLEFANNLLSATTSGTDGLGQLQEAADRFRTVLSGNPEIVERIAEALAELANVGVQQVSLLVDAITAFVAEKNNIDAIGESIESLAIVLVRLGQTARFIVALTEGIIGLKTRIDELPPAAEGFKASLDVLGLTKGFQIFGGVVELLNQAFLVLNTTVDSTKNFIQNLVDRFDFLSNNPVIKALLGQILQADEAAVGFGASLAQSATIGAEAVTTLGTATKEMVEDVNETEGLGEGLADTIEEEVEEAVSALDGLAAANRDALDDITTDTDNAKADLLENGGTQAEVAALEKKALEDRIAQNRTYLQELKDAQASGGLSEEEALDVADMIRDVEGRLASDRVSLAQQVVNAQRDAAKAAEDAAKESAKAQRDAAKAAEDAAKESAKAQRDAAKAAEDAAKERLRIAEEAEKARLQMIRDIAEQELADLRILAEQRAAILEQSIQANRDGLLILQEEQRLAQGTIELEREKLETLLAQAEADGNLAESARLKGEIADLNAQAVAQEFEFKRQQLELETNISRLEAQRVVTLADIAVAESEVNLQKAIGLGASKEEIANLKAIVALRKDAASSAREGAAVTEEVADLRSDQLDVEEGIAKENQAQLDIEEQKTEEEEKQLKSGKTRMKGGGGGGGAQKKQAELAEQIADAEERRASALVSALKTQEQSVEESQRELDLIRERFKEAREAGLFQDQGAEFDQAAKQLEQILDRGGSLKDLINFAKNTESGIAKSLLEGIGRGDVLQLLDADQQFKEPLVEGGAQAGNELEQGVVRGGQQAAQAISGAFSGLSGARRDGGPVKAGGTYLVGEAGPELVTPRRGGYVYTAQQTAALMAGLPTMRGVSVPALGSTARLEGLMGDLLQEVRKGRQVRPQSTYNLTTAAPVQDAMALQLAEIRALMDRRGL